MTEPRLVSDVLSPGQPSWIEQTFRFTTGVDPLGLQTITTDRIIPRLVPGILALSDRARYFSFYAWLLRRYADQHGAPTNAALSRFVLHREYEFALAVKLCPRRCGSGPTGSNRASPAVAASPAAFTRNESVESQLGGYGLYYRSPMRALGLVAPAGTLLGDQPTPVDVLIPTSAAGSRLADAFADAVDETTYVREFIDSEDPIPAQVLSDFAAEACLCRLPERPNEQAALRFALLDNAELQTPSDVASRREAFALVLDFARRTGELPANDDALRFAVWDAFEALPTAEDRRRRVVSRWAAVAATHFVHVGIMRIWESGGPKLRTAGDVEGLKRSDVRRVCRDMVDAAALILPGGEVATASTLTTAEFRHHLREAAAGTDLQDLVRWAWYDKQPLVGVALILLLIDRLPSATTADPAWNQYAAIDGEWQPGLSRLRRNLELHLAEEPRLGDTLAWMVTSLLLRPHETIAYSKLPDFTFRFRWDLGRLRFYDHPFSWTIAGDIRGSAMASLAADLGLWERVAERDALTPAGSAFVDEVFS